VEAGLLIQVASAVKFYDGKPLINPFYTFNEAQLFSGDSLIATVEGSITDVGTEENVLTAYWIHNAQVGDVTENYSVAVADGRLTVLPMETPLIITAASAQKTYDGMPLTSAEYAFDAALLCEGHTLEATVMGSITNVGTAMNIVTGWRIMDGENHDVTLDYTVQTVPGTLAILPAPVTEPSPGPSPAPTPAPSPRPTPGAPTAAPGDVSVGGEKKIFVGVPYNFGEIMQ
jgi:hypothetical protein